MAAKTLTRSAASDLGDHLLPQTGQVNLIQSLLQGVLAPTEGAGQPDALNLSHMAKGLAAENFEELENPNILMGKVEAGAPGPRTHTGLIEGAQ